LSETANKIQEAKGRGTNTTVIEPFNKISVTGAHN